MSVVIPSLRAAIAVPPWVKNYLWRSAQAIPSLDLRFADNKSLVDAVTGASLITFARASSGTVTDSAGTLQTAAIDVPRFDHNPTTGESLGLLVEEQRTNLLLRSEEFNNASWGDQGTAPTVTANATVAPNGTLTADRITFAAADSRKTQANISIVNGASYTFSVYALAIGAINNKFRLAFFDQAVQSTSADFTVSQSQWQRFTFTVTSTQTNNFGLPQIRNASDNAGNDIYFWGAQLEAGAFPTSYIPTTTAAATRSADVASIGSSAFTSFYNQSEGTMFVDFLRAYSGNFPNFPNLYQFNDGTNDNEITVLGIQGGQLFQPYVVIGTSSQINFVTVASIFPGPNRCAHSLSLNNSVFAGNGVLTTPDTSVNLPTVNQVKFGDRGGQRFTGHYKRICFWRQALPGATLQAITG